MNELEMIRGTTQALGIVILNEDGTEYTPQTGETVRFGMKHDPKASPYSLIKTGEYDSEQGCYVFDFSPSDTSSLTSAIYGEPYWYDVSVQTSGGELYNVIEPSLLLLFTSITGVS